jgi:hypothetical protein
MYNIKTLRGTIFCPPIQYSKDFVASLAPIVEGYLPILVRDNNTLPIFPVWQLSSLDEKELLAFNGEKIDLISVVESEINDEQVRAFCERCKVVFGKIMELTGNPSTRMALAPTVVITQNGSRPTDLYNRIFNVHEFDGVELDSSNLSQVYRVEKMIGEKNVIINFVSNFKAENELITTGNGNQIRVRYLCDFDVNTMPLPQYRFNKADVEVFFDSAPTYFSRFYNKYFDL